MQSLFYGCVRRLMRAKVPVFGVSFSLNPNVLFLILYRIFLKLKYEVQQKNR